jgi:polar amino acid transport system substrate-binding protein
MGSGGFRLLGLVRRLTRVLAIAIAIGGGLSPAWAEDNVSPDIALSRLLDSARAERPGDCADAGVDRLVQIVCREHIRIGVRSNYPQFGERDGETWRGFEIDLARAIAKRLGVEVVLVPVTPANRIALLAEDRIDLAIATIGHNTQRDGQARFVHPHYYRSETVLVGPRDVPLSGWGGVAGRTVCVTIGNGSNAELSARGARLMLFSNPGQLGRELRGGTCSLVAQDDTFFAASFSDPAFAALYDSKLGFAPVPWGMAVARDGAELLAHAVGLTTQVFHRDGILLDMARANQVATGFLAEQQTVWRRAACDTAAGGENPACVLPPLDATPRPTAFADRVSDVEAWLSERLGITLSLVMFKTAPAWSLLRSGVVNSLILVAGAITATLGVALTFGVLLSARTRLARWPMRVVVITLQSSPPVLALVIAAAMANAIAGYSAPAMIVAAIAALGLVNGANAGQAISESFVTLRSEQAAGGDLDAGLFVRCLSRSATQIESFLINAAKGTPIASFIGTPELLSALTDISSFSSDRVTTYSLLLIFYTAVVMVVVRLCAMFRSFLQWQGARA